MIDEENGPGYIAHMTGARFLGACRETPKGKPEGFHHRRFRHKIVSSYKYGFKMGQLFQIINDIGNFFGGV